MNTELKNNTNTNKAPDPEVAKAIAAAEEKQREAAELRRKAETLEKKGVFQQEAAQRLADAQKEFGAETALRVEEDEDGHVHCAVYVGVTRYGYSHRGWLDALNTARGWVASRETRRRIAQGYKDIASAFTGAGCVVERGAEKLDYGIVCRKVEKVNGTRVRIHIEEQYRGGHYSYRSTGRLVAVVEPASWRQGDRVRRYPELKAGGFNYKKIVETVLEEIRIAKACAKRRSEEEGARMRSSALATHLNLQLFGKERPYGVGTFRGCMSGDRVAMDLPSTVTKEQARALLATLRELGLAKEGK